MHNIKIIADENISRRILDYLKNAGYEVLSVYKQNRGIADADIIELAKTGKYIIITEDKDFGEWFFSQKEQGFSAVLLRYNYIEEQLVSQSLIKVLKKYGENLYGKFTVVSPFKIRIREFKTY